MIVQVLYLPSSTTDFRNYVPSQIIRLPTLNDDKRGEPKIYTVITAGMPTARAELIVRAAIWRAFARLLSLIAPRAD